MKIKANVAVFMKKIIRRFDWVQVWVIQKEVFLLSGLWVHIVSKVQSIKMFAPCGTLKVQREQ
jgi:hypothetical protein